MFGVHGILDSMLEDCKVERMSYKIVTIVVFIPLVKIPFERAKHSD